MSREPTPAEARLRELGPWENRNALVGFGPAGLLEAWVGKRYSVQRYAVDARAGWDRLHVQAHTRRSEPGWLDLQAIKLLLPEGARRLGFTVCPREERVVDLANAYHLWVLPLGHALEATLDLAEELARVVPPAPWKALA
jgi:hypothetical protein